MSKRKALVFFPHNPYPARTGAHARCLSMLQALRCLGYDVTLASSTLFTDSPWQQGSITALQTDLGIKTHIYVGSGRELQYVTAHKMAAFSSSDWQVFTPPGLKEFFGELHRRLAPDVVMINYGYWASLLDVCPPGQGVRLIETHDLITLNMKMQNILWSYLRQQPRPDKLIANESFFAKFDLQVERAEFNAYEKFDHTIAISRHEADLIASHTQRTSAQHIPMTFSTEQIDNCYQHFPVFVISANCFNVQGYIYMKEKVIPRLKTIVPEFAVDVVGSGCRILSPVEGLHLRGFVPELAAVYQQAKFAICPLIGGTGQQVKVVEAMAYGLPVVALRNTAQSSPIVHGENGFIANDDAQFAEYCSRLYRDRQLCRQMGQAARATVDYQFSQGILLDRLASIIPKARREECFPLPPNKVAVDQDELMYAAEKFLHKVAQNGQSFSLKAMRDTFETLFTSYGFRVKKDISQVKNILVLRLDEIGDVVLTSAFLRELRHSFPHAIITLVVKPETYNLIELCPYIDKIHNFDWRAIQQRAVDGHKTMVAFCHEKLWSEQFDLCIIPRYDHDMYKATLLAYLSGANLRVAYTEQTTPLKVHRNKGFDQLLTHVVPGGGVKHEVERSLDILRHLGCTIEDSSLALWTEERDDQFAAQALSGSKELRIALSPGKEDNVRGWPIDRYIEVASYLVARYNARILIFGSAAEAEMGQRLKAVLPQRVVDFSGRTTLRQTAALLKQCHLYIGRDTGVMHMATAVGTPIVEICCHARSADPGYMYSPRRFGPWGVPTVILQPETPVAPCQKGCHHSGPHCILQITVEQVKVAVGRMLSKQVAATLSGQDSSIHLPQVVVPKVKHNGGNNMRILFIHPNFPAQFLNLAPALGKNPNNQVVFLTNRKEGSLPGVHKVYYAKAREVAPQTHNYVRPLEDAVLQGQAACRTAMELKKQGFVPDVIYAHSGWGPGMFMKEIFPQAAVINYFEWFYHSHGTDADFDPLEPVSIDGECRIRAKNAAILIDVCSCDRGVSPTYYQRSQFPTELQPKISVLHDGVNSDFYQPKPDAKLVLPNSNLDLSEVKEIVTYVGRGMEPYRGFPQFMEAIDILLKRRPNCHVVIVGADRVAYGKTLPNGKTYKELMLEKLDIDLMRVHFTGLLPYNQYRQVLQASSAHVYLTRPFVLSWSMLEAMSAGCLLVASDTAPVKEVIKDGENGLLVDFFSPPQIASRLEEALDNPERMAGIRQKARQTILDKYALNKLLPQQITLLEQIVAEKR